MAGTRLCSIAGCDKPAWIRGLCSAHYQRWQRHGDPLGGRQMNGEAPRFFREVVLPYAGDDCLIWPYGRLGNGYGWITYGGARQYVHRLACAMAHGPAPSPEHEAAHSCGRGHEGCCNPRHLRWATHAQNMAEMADHGTTVRGRRNWNARLTEDEVRKIRALKGGLRHHEIAEMFGISRTTVSVVQSRKRWAWL